MKYLCGSVTILLVHVYKMLQNFFDFLQALSPMYLQNTVKKRQQGDFGTIQRINTRLVGLQCGKNLISESTSEWLKSTTSSLGFMQDLGYLPCISYHKLLLDITAPCSTGLKNFISKNNCRNKYNTSSHYLVTKIRWTKGS